MVLEGRGEPSQSRWIGPFLQNRCRGFLEGCHLAFVCLQDPNYRANTDAHLAGYFLDRDGRLPQSQYSASSDASSDTLADNVRRARYGFNLNLDRIVPGGVCRPPLVSSAFASPASAISKSRPIWQSQYSPVLRFSQSVTAGRIIRIGGSSGVFVRSGSPCLGRSRLRLCCAIHPWRTPGKPPIGLR